MQLDEHLPRLLADAPVIYHDPETVSPQNEVGAHLRRMAQRGTQLRAIQPLLRPLRWASIHSARSACSCCCGHSDAQAGVCQDCGLQRSFAA